MSGPEQGEIVSTSFHDLLAQRAVAQQSGAQRGSEVVFLDEPYRERPLQTPAGDQDAGRNIGRVHTDRDLSDTQEQPAVTRIDRRRRGCGPRAGAVLLAGAAGLGLLAWAASDDGGDDGIEITAADLDQFRVKSYNAEACETNTATSGTGNINAFLGPVPDLGFKKPVVEGSMNQDQRRWADAVRNPLTTNHKVEEIFTSLCEDDGHRAMTGQFLTILKFGDTKLTDLEGNEWLKRYAVGEDGINDIAQSDLDAMEAENPDKKVTGEEAKDILEAARLREADAERMIELLNRLTHGRIVKGQTVLNYRFAGASMQLAVPEMELGPQYTGEFLEFAATTKAGECLVRIGFNTLDQRLAVLVCETPPKVPGTTQPPRRPTTTVPGRPTTTVPHRPTTTVPASSTTTTTGVTTTTITVGPKIVKCVTPGGAVNITDRNGNGIADEPECNQLQNNGQGAGGQEGTTETTRINATTTTTGSGTTPPSGVRPTAPPVTGTTNPTAPPSTIVTIPPPPSN